MLANTASAQLCATPGQDGPTNAGLSINTYYPAANNITLAAGATSVLLAAVPVTDAYGNSFGNTQIKSGDLLMVIQMQDATINFANSNLYGSGNSTTGPDGLGGTGFTSLGSAGKFEFLVATNNVPLTGGTLTFKGAGNNKGVVNSYRNLPPTAIQGKCTFQVIRITQYSSLVLSSDISPPPFNGSAGGVIAFDVAGVMNFNGYKVDVSAKGFRGGYSPKRVPTSNYNSLYVTSADDSRASGKGEGIAGTPRYMWDGFNQIDNIDEGLPGGSGGKGAAANAGGGGNDTNAGGGGGGNGGAGGVGAWGYEPYGGTFPNGGRPGTGIYANGNADLTRLVMGGGGGGGHANDALTGVKGGVGGGIVFINAKTIIGTATILANGSNGAPGAFGGNPDGSGGGGAGGSVLIKISNPVSSATINISANGGRGGNTEGDDINNVQPHGPGGGGGGGVILFDIATGTKSFVATGGAAGKTNSGLGRTHNSEPGRDGILQAAPAGSFPPYLQPQGLGCYPEIVTDIKEADPTATKNIGGVATFTVTVSNNASDGNAGGVIADLVLPNGLAFKSASVVYTAGAGGPGLLTNQGTSDHPLLGEFNIGPGSKVKITLIADITCSIPSGTYNTSVQAVYLDPTRSIADPTRRVTAPLNAFAGTNTTYQNSTDVILGKNYNGTNTIGEEVTVSNNIANNVASANPTEVCASTFSPLALSGNEVTATGIAYKWQASTDNATFTDVPGANGRDFNPPTITNTTYYRRVVLIGSCIMYSNVITIVVNKPPDNNIISSNNTSLVCNSFDPSIISGTTATGGNGTYSYQWQSSIDGINYSDISGAIQTSYDPIIINTTTYYRRKVTSGTCDALSNVIQIVVEQPLVNNILNQPPVTAFCGNLDPSVITGTTPTGGNGTFAYQWQSSSDGVNFNNIGGATFANYDPPVITQVIYFRRVVSSGICAVSTSNNIQFSTTPALANNQITGPSTLAFCGNGDPDVLQGSVPTGGDGNYSYQWQSSTNGVNFTNIAGAVSVDYNPWVINSTTYYRRSVLSGACELISNVVQITVQPVLSSNTITPQLPTSFCASGDAGLISGSIPPTGVTYNYQWQSSTDGIAFADISGANAASYDPPLVTQTIYYRRLVSSSVCVVPLISNVVVINVDPALSNNLITPPAVTSFCNTGTPGTIIGSLPAGGNGVISFQWQVSTDGIVFSNIAGATQRDFNPSVLNSTAFYRRIITSGNCTVPNISNVVKINIDPLVGNNIVTSPATTSFCGNGQPGIITGSTPSGGNGIYVYQWQRSADNINFIDVPGATQKDYMPGVLSSSTYYRRVVTSGSCTMPLTSNAVFFQIIPVIQNNNIIPPPTVSFCASGDPAIVTGSTPTGGMGTYSYQWQSSVDGVNFSNMPGATSKDFDPPLLNVTTYYRRLVTSGACNVPQVSNAVSFTIDILPVIDLGPEVTICVGSGAMLNLSGANAGYTYSWSPSIGLSNPGVASPIASPLVNTTYTLTVTNGTCLTTATVSIKVIPKPIVSAGSDKEVFKGSSVLLNATATGNNLKYSWSPATYLDNPNIAQPTASPTEDNNYTLTVTSENNCFTVYDDVFVKVYPGVSPPNTFSPNNDGINDVWTIPGLSLYKNTTVSIFNRNGEMLYQSINYTKEWDGTYRGKPVPFGTYYYIIDIKNAGIATTRLSGWVSVVR